MRRNLPHRANLEHLKKQAKDLLDGHKRAVPEALARIRDALPAFASVSDEAIAKAPLRSTTRNRRSRASTERRAGTSSATRSRLSVATRRKSRTRRCAR
jgi:hypothetical protein